MSEKYEFHEQALEEALHLKSLQPFTKSIGLIFEQYRLTDLNPRSVGFIASFPVLGGGISDHRKLDEIHTLLERALRMSYPDMLVDISQLDEEGETFYIEAFV